MEQPGLDSTVDKAQDALEDLKDKVDRKETTVRSHRDDATGPVAGRQRRSLTWPCAGRSAPRQLRDQRMVPA